MGIFLTVLAMFWFLVGGSLYLLSSTSIHETEALVMLLISAVFLAGAGIVEAVNTLRSEVLSARPFVRLSENLEQIERTLRSLNVAGGEPSVEVARVEPIIRPAVWQQRRE